MIQNANPEVPWEVFPAKTSNPIYPGVNYSVGISLSNPTASVAEAYKKAIAAGATPIPVSGISLSNPSASIVEAYKKITAANGATPIQPSGISLSNPTASVAEAYKRAIAAGATPIPANGIRSISLLPEEKKAILPQQNSTILAAAKPKNSLLREKLSIVVAIGGILLMVSAIAFSD